MKLTGWYVMLKGYGAVEGPYMFKADAQQAVMLRSDEHRLPETLYYVELDPERKFCIRKPRELPKAQVTNDAPGFPGVAGPEQGIPAKDVVAMGDMKAALRGGVKPDLTHIRTPLLNYIARACEYGNDKYERSNYLRVTSGLPADFERLRAYLRAAISHTLQTLDAMEAHQATDPKLEDVEGMKKAALAVDTDPDKTGKVGPSMLPHLCGAAASFMMAITQAANAGLLPADPGTPWRK
jgi:hypothetical protein